MKHHLPSRSRLVLTAAVVVAFGAGLTTAVLVGGADGPGDDVGAQGIKLVSFDTCDTALSEMKARLMPHVGPYGLDMGGGRGAEEDVAVADSAESSGAGEGGAAAPGTQFDSKAAPMQAAE